ncbi:MAG: helix-turn-helix protein [Pelotomaculum sp. PtaU1.Bin035]|nr:MAG: helix-turn-helix protein [Pelotomaculum sp. PtaU1.Bin035]
MGDIYQLDAFRTAKATGDRFLPRFDFGKYLAQTRKKQGLTQEQLGNRIDYDRSMVSRWETSALEVRPAEAAALAKAMGEPNLLTHYCSECSVGKTYNEMCRPKPAA